MHVIHSFFPTNCLGKHSIAHMQASYDTNKREVKHKSMQRGEYYNFLEEFRFQLILSSPAVFTNRYRFYITMHEIKVCRFTKRAQQQFLNKTIPLYFQA